jgi:predicted ester cyclase
MPDFHVTIEDMVTEGDKVASRWTASGTHQGEFLGIRPTGNHATWTGITIYRIADGKIVEAWWSKDVLALLQQLVVIPPMPGGPPFMDRKDEDYLWGEPSAVTGDPGDPEANKALYLREIEEVWHQGNLDVLDEIFSAGFVNHDLYWGAPDRESYKQWVASQLSSAPSLTVDCILAEGDRVACRWTSRFTDPDSEKQATCVGVDICRFADGKIVERWWSKDMLGVLQQLGMIPTPERGE